MDPLTQACAEDVVLTPTIIECLIPALGGLFWCISETFVPGYFGIVKEPNPNPMGGFINRPIRVIKSTIILL